MPATDLEQYELELINAARLDPLGAASRYISSYSPLTSPSTSIANALSYFSVSGPALQSALAALAPAQPLAFNDALANAARSHNGAMIASDSQSHQVAGEAALGPRLSAAGYSYTSAGENVYAYASDPLFGHAGFVVDWGPGPNGMQSPAGHRDNIMNASFREVGIGVTPENDPSTAVGPLVITEDFGRRSGSGVFVLGVAYRDLDRDDFYSVGEGVAGLNLNLSGAAASTSAGGGFTLSTPAFAAQALSLTGGGLSGTVEVTMSAADGQNIKLDVVDGTMLKVSGSVSVAGPISQIVGLGLKGLSLQAGGGGQAIFGTVGHDTIDGGDGNDYLVGGIGNDTLYGSGGNDVLIGDNGGGSGSGADLLFGMDGDDVAFGCGGNDSLNGGLGADALYGNEGDDRLLGNSGGDQLYGNEGNDVLIGDEEGGGGTGRDYLVGGSGNDTAYGGGGDDTLIGDEPGGSGTGKDALYGNEGTDILYGCGGDDYLVGGDGLDVLYGGDGADVMIGDSEGGGGVGNDVLSGGLGIDVVYTGAGNDTVQLDVAPGMANYDIVYDFASGTDHVALSSSIYGAANTGNGAVRFVAGPQAVATTNAATVIYDTYYHALLYDADGNGAGAAQLMATLPNTATMTAADLFFI